MLEAFAATSDGVQLFRLKIGVGSMCYSLCGWCPHETATALPLRLLNRLLWIQINLRQTSVLQHNPVSRRGECWIAATALARTKCICLQAV